MTPKNYKIENPIENKYYSIIVYITMSVRNRIIQIYQSRLNILNILESIYGYDISEYSGFSINEVDAMIINNQLDMLLTHGPSENMPKTYIKYYLAGTLNARNMYSITDDLFGDSEILGPRDCLCIIYDGEPNESLISHLNYIYAQKQQFVVAHNLKRLQFNILEHSLVPKVSILTDNEVDALKKQYTIDDMKQLPEISRYDPQALAICLRPGQVCKFIRNSPTAMEAPYYRVCV